MTKTLAALALGCGILFGMQAGPVQAGVFELFHDDITTSCDEHTEPCKRNNIGYVTRYRHGPYLRYGIKTTAARYVWRHERVMIEPPMIVTGRRVHTHKLNGKRLAIAEKAGHYRTVRPARYAVVARRVLVAPARSRVVRLHPTTAYFADTIIVKGGGCKRPLSRWKCR